LIGAAGYGCHVEAGTSHDYAGWLARVGAQLIDQLALLLAAVAGGLIVGAAAGEDAGILAAIAVYLVGMLLYYTYFHGSESGQTLGKRAASIAVRSDTGVRASYGQAFGRVAIMWIFQLFSPVQLLNFLWPLWDRRNQALHDKIASTIVVKAH
jgi:uncharacterized RDD family membrane protein YckC